MRASGSGRLAGMRNPGACVHDEAAITAVTHAASDRGSCHAGQPRNGDRKAMTPPSREWVVSGRYCLLRRITIPGSAEVLTGR